MKNDVGAYQIQSNDGLVRVAVRDISYGGVAIQGNCYSSPAYLIERNGWNAYDWEIMIFDSERSASDYFRANRESIRAATKFPIARE